MNDHCEPSFGLISYRSIWGFSSEWYVYEQAGDWAYLGSLKNVLFFYKIYLVDFIYLNRKSRHINIVRQKSNKEFS